MDKHTREHDAQVAEIVGYKDIFDAGGGEILSGIDPHYKIVPPFLTAPTDESDGIVLRWVQGHLTHEPLHQYQLKVDSIANTKNKPLSAFLHNYKPGMYAQAVLELRKEGNREVDQS